MQPIYPNLYQFSTYIPPLDFTIHQYLLCTDPAVLFASGTMQQAEQIVPQVQEILAGRPLGYIFVSHMESDECGGLAVFLRAYPAVTVVCSPLCARELPGFGYTGRILTGAPDTPLRAGALDLRFIRYPAEVHLQDGLVCFEQNSGIFYSADLMQRRGNGCGQVIPGRWQDEVTAIGPDRVPDGARLRALQQSLLTIQPAFVAVGHGFCVACSEA